MECERRKTKGKQSNFGEKQNNTVSGKRATHDMKQISSETVIQWGRTTWRMRHARCLRLIAGNAEMERGKESEKERERQPLQARTRSEIATITIPLNKLTSNSQQFHN